MEVDGGSASMLGQLRSIDSYLIPRPLRQGISRPNRPGLPTTLLRYDRSTHLERDSSALPPARFFSHSSPPHFFGRYWAVCSGKQTDGGIEGTVSTTTEDADQISRTTMKMKRTAPGDAQGVKLDDEIMDDTDLGSLNRENRTAPLEKGGDCIETCFNRTTLIALYNPGQPDLEYV
ncbi:hypothetical protein Cgig2_010863 [Carnegiea gigantea]|uniref:Uncharacterized protein n=1 Tax=Carnegiea gigantea TaxID=171969 RepID=A0A9Q1JIT0_9CARY|nr:hypothetical protein Cgig2_010863 [Carnegiea gigantea]